MRVKYILLALALIGFVGLGVANITHGQQKLQVKDIQLQSKSADLNKLQLDFKKLNINLQTELQQKNVNQEQVKKLEDEKVRLQQQLDEAQRQLQARAAEKQRLASLQVTPKAYAATAPAYVAPVASVVGNCGDNEYAHYIYMHESGCDTNRYNSIGCYGIGQSCPKSKIAHCGADYGCQNAWFTAYAQKYGGWAGAYQFWLAHQWW